jgi:TPR repeat protein
MKASSILGLCMVLVSGSVLADELADADKLMAAKDYTRALPIYAKLAAGGNAVAQFHLGELYWYGEGTAVDMAKGDELFKKAADAGVADAKAALQMTPQRQAKLGQIDYYANKYDGSDIALAKFNCVKPDIPAMSTNVRDIKAVGVNVDAWLACYNGFVKNLNSLLPAGKAIPADLPNLMTDAEFAQSIARMDQAYAAAGADAKKQADSVNLAQAAWEAKTTEYVKTASARSQNALTQRQAETDQQQNWDQNMRVGSSIMGKSTK